MHGKARRRGGGSSGRALTGESLCRHVGTWPLMFVGAPPTAHLPSRYFRDASANCKHVSWDALSAFSRTTPGPPAPVQMGRLVVCQSRLPACPPIPSSFSGVDGGSAAPLDAHAHARTHMRWDPVKPPATSTSTALPKLPLSLRFGDVRSRPSSPPPRREA